MKKFKFRLQRVLDYRNSLTKEAERELAIRNRRYFEAEELLRGIDSEIENSKPIGEGEVSMAELMLGGEYQRYLRQALIVQRLAVLEAADAVDEAREFYVKRAIDSKSLDRLRERYREEYRDEFRKNEKKKLDEMVVQRHRLSKGGIGNA